MRKRYNRKKNKKETKKLIEFGEKDVWKLEIPIEESEPIEHPDPNVNSSSLRGSVCLN